MKGHTSPDCGPGPISKWTAIHRTLCEKKISILCLQETHLEDEHIHTIGTLFGRRLEIIHSKHPTNPGSTAGITIVINKEQINTHSITSTELVPGRAMALMINWHDDQRLTILNIYAPNSPHAHAHFWTKIRNDIDNHPHCPNLLLGDFNLVKDTIDRAPAHKDYKPATPCLRDLRNTIGVQDIWRTENPTTRMYTFASNANSLSRLDRIYAHPQLTKSLYKWTTIPTPIPSDHKMVSVRLAPSKTLYVSKGRWTWPLALLHNKELTQQIVALGMELQASLDHPATIQPTNPNAQQKWSRFKTKITDLAKRTAKTQLAKMDNHINTLKNKIVMTEQDPELDTQQPVRASITTLENEL